MPSGSAGSRLLLRLRQPALSGHSFAERNWPAESATESWSGRRGSNPRPTAWKAVTLPLSYSRLRDPCALRYGGQARVFPPPSARAARPAAYPLRLPSPTQRLGWLACQPQPAADRFSSRSGGPRLVARGGFEPPKPLGRQIYSLLRLTAPQPRRCFDRHTTANSCQMLAETEVARFMNPTAFGRRCIPHARRWASRSAGSNAAGMLPPRALRGRRLDALGASPYS